MGQSFHDISNTDLLLKFNSSLKGLSSAEAQSRLETYGPNTFPSKAAKTVFKIFFQQFLNPLIYVLVAAAVLSMFLNDYTDAFFIALVLVINAVIGTIQEYGAEKSALALQKLASTHSKVLRNGNLIEIEAEKIVPGDIIHLESGNKVPADIRLLQSQSLEVNESLLTGESLPVAKNYNITLPTETALADRTNMAFTGALVTKGRAKGLVVSTSLATELGKIADSLTSETSAKPPLLIRMESFTKKIAIYLSLICFLMALYLVIKGQSWGEVMLFTVALAVAAIPEGLPIALTVALAIASRRMAKHNVIVRKLPAVESLGSCTYIATDKTGTLTVNQLTIQKIAIPHQAPLTVEGSGLEPNGKILLHSDLDASFQNHALQPFIETGVLCNEATLNFDGANWEGQGDAVDLAFLVLAHKHHQSPEEIRKRFKLIEEIPFEPENQYAASFHEIENSQIVSVKGALEKILPLCKSMLTVNGERPLDTNEITKQAHQLAKSGYRILALAKKILPQSYENYHDQLRDLTFLGLAAMIDPLRPEATEAIQTCQNAGIQVGMITGDHPITALAISQQLGLANDMNSVISGPQLKSAPTIDDRNALINSAKVFARVEPQQKLEIVQHLIKQGRFVAVTGDGANDAPALKVANVGIAMGKSGTDVAKETADLIITDDRFASIVAGIREGRIAYSNVRKVVYLVMSTGVAEIFMITLSLFFNTPLPLTAVQLLWLNLVTNGIQDIGLASEPGEGNELTLPPRHPQEPIFNRLMIERIILSSLVMGGVSFWYFNQSLNSGFSLMAAQNLTLLLMVLFENIMIGNCRSETQSAFALNPLRNPFLLVGTIAAQLIHIAALYTPGLRDILGVSPISITEWTHLLLLSLSVLVVMEAYKFIRSRWHN